MHRHTCEVITHDGRFHTDEVSATALISAVHKDHVMAVKRTRNIDALAAATAAAKAKIEGSKVTTYVVDVGFKYEPDNGLFDHHQESFTDTFSSKYDIPMSSFGLVYKQFGPQWVTDTFDDYIVSANADVASSDITFDTMPKTRLVKTIYHQFYRQFVLPIDANDNGVKLTKSIDGMHDLTMIDVIAGMNSNDHQNNTRQHHQFKKAVGYARFTMQIVLTNIIRSVIQDTINRETFKIALELNPQEFEDHCIFYMHKPGFVSKYIAEIDQEQNKYFLVITNASKTDEPLFKIGTIRKNGCGFRTIVPLICESTAKSVCGDDVIFIHKKLFCGSFKTLTAAVTVAKLSLAKTSDDVFASAMD